MGKFFEAQLTRILEFGGELKVRDKAEAALKRDAWGELPIESVWRSAGDNRPPFDMDYLRALQSYINYNPQYVQRLLRFKPKRPDAIPSLIINQTSYILTRVGETVSIVDPQISCTQNAIFDLFSRRRIASDGSIIVTSSPDIMSIMTYQSARDIQFNYYSNETLPEDYVTLSGVGFLNNDGYRYIVGIHGRNEFIKARNLTPGAKRFFLYE